MFRGFWAVTTDKQIKTTKRDEQKWKRIGEKNSFRFERQENSLEVSKLIMVFILITTVTVSNDSAAEYIYAI